MFANLEDVEGQAQMAHCLLAEESATVTPQKSLRTPLKMIGGCISVEVDTVVDT